MAKKKRVLLCLSHSIEEFDQLKLLHGLGYEVASIGGYINPREPHDPKRPALDIDQVDAIRESVDSLGTDDNLGNAQARIPNGVIEWLGANGVIIFHHYLDQRLWPQWDHLRDWREAGGRVVWRTVGQSVEHNERVAAPYHADGLEIVRYSPKERNIPGFAGEDALIRFYKDEQEWSGWEGQRPVITNHTQDLIRRGNWCNLGFYLEATKDLPTEPVGPGSEELRGGLGLVPLQELQTLLRDARAYIYTGTQPASYTLGLVEALMVGIPVVSIGPNWMTFFPYSSELFEGHELAEISSDDPAWCRDRLLEILNNYSLAEEISDQQRMHAVSTFGMKAVGSAWKKFLG